MSDAALWGLGVATLVVGVLTAVMSGLLERSGLIPLRQWSSDAGGRLERLSQRRRGFEAYRLLLSMLSRLSLLGVFVVAAALSASPWVGLAVALPVLLVTEVATRILVAHDPTGGLRRLTGAYRVALVLFSPLLPLLRLSFPAEAMERREEPDEPDEASEGEIDAFISVGQREGILEPGEELLVKGVVEFGDTLVKSVMTPRTDIVGGTGGLHGRRAAGDLPGVRPFAHSDLRGVPRRDVWGPSSPATWSARCGRTATSGRVRSVEPPSSFPTASRSRRYCASSRPSTSSWPWSSTSSAAPRGSSPSRICWRRSSVRSSTSTRCSASIASVSATTSGCSPVPAT